MDNQQKLNYFKKALPEIQQLQTYELDEFMQDQSLRNLPGDVMQFLLKAVDIRRHELKGSKLAHSIMAAHASISLQDI